MNRIPNTHIDNTHFNAILAKNDIARELKKEIPNIQVILSRLEEIESYIGCANQPSVMAIFTSLIDI
jgi:hypothetical protein